MTWTARKSVVVPVDFSEETEAALNVGLDYAGDAKNLHVVHVLAPLTPVEPAVMWST
ncbi:MAG: universal stress protein, partial [Gemmatimonadetes bacterium]|nr:universal stress protein [Gemmatimonadota bacterium]